MVTVNFYRIEETGEIITICEDCQKLVIKEGERLGGLTLSKIDKAGEGDMCVECLEENV